MVATQDHVLGGDVGGGFDLAVGGGFGYPLSMDQNSAAQGEINALLGRGTQFSGKLTFQGRVRIDGQFSGEVFSSDVLVVGEMAEVRAEIEVGTLIVRGGAIWGNIKATELVEVHAPGRVYGNIHSPELFIDKGVVFEGQCFMTPKAGSENASEAKDAAARPAENGLTQSVQS